MDTSQITEELLFFIEKSPTAFQAVETMKEELEANGFARLYENEKWQIHAGGSYYVTRNDSALIAFTVPEGESQGIHIMASHSDSPSFKIKENPEMETEGHYIRLNVEGYGGMLCTPWMDRPLSVAGRVIVKQDGRCVSRPVMVDRDLALIPNLAIHMNREANNGFKYNAQKDMLPLYGAFNAKDSFFEIVTKAAGVERKEILGADLFLYNRQQGTVWGVNNEFVSAPRLDDLQCAFASLKGFLAGKKEQYISLHCVLDNEEVGSQTKQGAASTFLYDTLTRMCECLGYSHEEYLIQLANGFMLSADNAHAVHPNHPELADPVNRVYMNEGIVLKFNAAQKYATDGVAAAAVRDLCDSAGVPIQTFTNRSDQRGGSTLGNISNTRVAVSTADIGLAQLAMHSPYETAGVKDTEYLIRLAAEFFK